MNISTSAKGKIALSRKEGVVVDFSGYLDVTTKVDNVTAHAKIRNGLGEMPPTETDKNAILRVRRRVEKTKENLAVSIARRGRGKSHERVPQLQFTRIGKCPPDIIAAGVNKAGLEVYGGQIVIPNDGKSFVTVTPGKNSHGAITVILK